MRIPAEGEDGLFTQSWFPIAMSSEVRCGQLIGRDFLDGKVLVFRDAAGRAQVLSGFCLHVGTDLSNARVVDDCVECPFHHWRYNVDGRCIATGIGDPVPPRAQLFRFPTVEKFGLIWAFNGEQPLWQIDDLSAPYAEEELILRVRQEPRHYDLDPWVIRANTPDWQHFAFVHGMAIQGDVAERFRWSDYRVALDVDVHLDHGSGESLEYRIQISGTTIWSNVGKLSGKWHLQLSALTIPRPGTCSHYYVLAAPRGDGSARTLAAANGFLDHLESLFERMLREDARPLANLHYKPGLLTAADKALARYLKYIKDYPRAHPSRDFIT
jgi:phenylpropionate dioxygenase-like ring-hydroxylating dioxygenase large terminal subunit